MSAPLPPGQYELNEFPRFGIGKYANRFPRSPDKISVNIGGDISKPFQLEDELRQLERVEQISDFHCVTTWSKRDVAWGGYRFSNFYESIVLGACEPENTANFVIFRCQDGFRAAMQLDDLMKADVLLADTLEGSPLSIANGAPLRLVAPSHYGYKSPKHICGIEFWRDDRKYSPPAFAFMDHPRGRVEYEERGQWVSGRLLRWLYRPLVSPTRRKFRDCLSKHSDKNG